MYQNLSGHQSHQQQPYPITLLCDVQVLALLFMARADVGYTVRQAAVHVWKTIVTNTPRTTGEILKTLMEQIIISLGHPSKTSTSCGNSFMSLALAVVIACRALLQLLQLLYTHVVTGCIMFVLGG